MRSPFMSHRPGTAVTLTLIAVFCLNCHFSDSLKVNTELAGREKEWTFLGSEQPWKQVGDGTILSPQWARLGVAPPPLYYASSNPYSDDLNRADFAFPSLQALSDVELSVQIFMKQFFRRMLAFPLTHLFSTSSPKFFVHGTSGS